MQNAHSAIHSTFIKLPFAIMATLNNTIIGFQDQLSLNAGQKYYRMLQREHSAIHSTFIKLQVVNKTFVLSIFEWSYCIPILKGHLDDKGVPALRGYFGPL